MSAQPASTFDLPTFVVAAVGAATGVASLGWNLVEHVLTGAKIRVTIDYIAQSPKPGAKMLPALRVTAVNKRRGAIQARGWAIVHHAPGASDRSFWSKFTPDTDDSDQARVTLQGKHGASWTIYARQLPAYILAENQSSSVELRGAVELGDGNAVMSKPVTVGTNWLREVPTVSIGA